MVLPAPNLDDRDFQSLVDDAKRLVQQRCPEWTDHNVSDPGVTLIEAFAQMTDQLIYRLNRVPDRHYVKFLELIGVQLFPPTAARGTATFWLAAAQPATVLVRAETEVATARTDAEESIIFSTTADLPIVPCEFSRIATAGVNGDATDLTSLLDGVQQVPAFSDVPGAGEALLIGLSAAVPSCAVLLRIDCPVGGIGIDPRQPPLVWEAWSGRGWSACDVDRDETGGLNRAGDVVLHVPATHEQSLIARNRAGWLRCRVLPPDGITPTYTRTPRIAGVRAMTVGGTAEIVHAETVRGEVLGTSDGAPGQRFTLQRHPVVPWREASVLEAVEPGGRTTSWSPVRDFARSGPEDLHYRLDAVTGEIEFGPSVRQPDGAPRQYGAVPPPGAALRVSAYRVGGGRRGNTARGVIRVLKTSVPYVSRVENRHPASGGVDGETMPNARLRGPLELRASGRAVTADDFEVLARDVAPDAARVKCLPAGETTAGAGRSGDDAAGGIRLLVVPRVVTDEVGRIGYDDVRHPPEELLRRIGEHLDARRVIGTRLLVQPPAYRGVTVVARITAASDARPERVQTAALKAVYDYLSPQDGGPAGDGWPFGRPVQAFDVSGVLARVDGVAQVDDVLLFPADPETGERGAPAPRVAVAPGTLVFSYQHQVRVQS